MKHMARHPLDDHARKATTAGPPSTSAPATCRAGTIQYPPLGALLAKELGQDGAVLPNFVSIAPDRLVNPAVYRPGFLGPQYAPLIVGDAGVSAGQRPGPFDYERALKVQDMEPPRGVLPAHLDARLDLLQDMERDFVTEHPGMAPLSHQSAYERAAQLMRTAAAKAFNLEEEKDSLRDAYGRNLFGQGCLLARRLVEQGVPFVEVTLGGVNGGALGWDTHTQNFDTVRSLSGVLDPAWATLMEDLEQRGLLDSTLIVWMGEFGRTPHINGQRGRDHFPNAWSTVLAGGGIKGGQVIGSTSPDGSTHPGAAGAGARFPGHHLPGAGRRSHQAEPVQRRPAHPHRGQIGPAHPGGAGMRRGRCGGLLIGCWVALAGPPGADEKAPAPASEVVDVVFLGDTGPVLIRLRVRIDGQPYQTVYRAAWDNYLQALFRHLDRDGDGFLSEAEAQRLPPPPQLSPGDGSGRPTNLAFNFRVVDTDGNGKIDLPELTAYYRDCGGAGLLVGRPSPPRALPPTGSDGLQGIVSPVAVPVSAAVNEALFSILDTNKDGKLSQDELAAAEAVLVPLETEGDELLTPADLVSGRPVLAPVPANNASAAASPFVFLGQGVDGPALARRLRERCGRRPEWEKFADRAPDMECVVRLGKTQPHEPALEILATARPSACAVRLPRGYAAAHLWHNPDRVACQRGAPPAGAALAGAIPGPVPGCGRGGERLSDAPGR